jgi:rRNA maturation endonuclease Nob1
MPRHVELSSTDEDYLKQNHTTLSYNQMADDIGCCTDTLKRILVRLGLQEFDGAKYQLRREADLKTWTRPCMGCGSEKKRPKNHYFCKACRRERGYED